MKKKKPIFNEYFLDDKPMLTLHIHAPDEATDDVIDNIKDLKKLENEERKAAEDVRFSNHMNVFLDMSKFLFTPEKLYKNYQHF